MKATKKEKVITKLYPPQIAKYENQLVVYSPLEHWVELHSSTSIKDMIEIDDNAFPYFLNNNNQKIILQNQSALLSLQQISDGFSKICKVYQHDHAFASETVRFNEEYYVNLDQEGSINLLPLSNLQYNPQCVKEISTKAQIQFGSIQSIELAINIDSLSKRYQNGLNLAKLAVENQQIFTLHSFKDQEEQPYVKIYKTDLNESESNTNSFRDYLPCTIQGLIVEGNSIWAYGSDNLLLIDSRSESIVSKMNDMLSTEITYVKKHEQNRNLLYVCRNASVLLQDSRKPSQIVEVVLNCEQNIEAFDVIKEGGEQIFCLSSAFDGKVHFYENYHVSN